MTSALAGKSLGSCPECSLVLIHSVSREDGLRWAAQQPWIDIVSNSWGGYLSQGGRTAGFTHPEDNLDQRTAVSREVAAAGKVVIFASGNGVAGVGNLANDVPQHGITYDSPYQGPAWVLTVGAARLSGDPSLWHDVPVDVTSYGEKWPAAAEDSTTGRMTFGGTSNAAPVAAGVIGAALLETRARTLDAGVGSRDGSLVHAGGRQVSRGPLADGILTRAELVEAAKAVAHPRGASPDSFAVQGYGLLDEPRARDLAAVLLGRRPIPARPEMADWAERHRSIRTLLWGESPE